MTKPAPISWPPSEYWDGDDGSWSSFALRVGNPEQTSRVLPSTAGQATWVVISQGCGQPGTSAFLNCNESRGGLFDPKESKSWQSLGNYSLGLEHNLGYDETATYGLDTVALGFTNATGGAGLGSQVVSGLATDDYYTGMFGLGQQPTNFTDLHNPHPSFLTSLKNASLIPSLSWAYTAGAPYRLKGVFGSLTFGGYDASRFIPNNVSFSLASDISRDIVVGLQSITSAYANGSAIALLPSPILTFIDSTLPFIYLPFEACQAFEKAYGLEWNTTAELYFVDEQLHESLTASNPTFTFQIADSTTGGPTVDIALPYASFDLKASHPFVANSTRYFPLQRAANDSQNTLGRAFLQEAYLITNYEYSNFSVAQARFENGLKADIVPIPSPTSVQQTFLSLPEKVGIGFGVTAFVVVVVLLVIVAIRRWRSSSSRKRNSDAQAPLRLFRDAKSPIAFSIQEKDHHNSQYNCFSELPVMEKAELLDETSPSGSGYKIKELSPPVDVVHELSSHRSSKETYAVHKYQPTSKFAVYVSTGIRRESQTITSTKQSPGIKTTISSPPSDMTPNLDRSLPPTPISESPQVSPIAATFDTVTRTRRLEARSQRGTSVAIGLSRTNGQDPPNTPICSVAKPGQCGQQRSRRGGFSVDMEIVVPPGQSASGNGSSQGQIQRTDSDSF